MELKALLYTEKIAMEEKQFNSLIQENQQKMICCAIKSGKDQNHLKNRIEAELTRIGINEEDCLYVMENKEEWDAAQALGIAALPYVPAGRKQPEAFLDAWIIVEGFEDVDMDFFQKAYERAHNLPWTILQTKRCIIREFSMDDMQALFDLYAQPQMTEFMEPLYDWETEKAYEEAYISNMYRYYGYGMWLVCKKDTGKLIGRAGLEHRDYGGKTELEMGYMICPKEQRKGYATEVCRALIAYAEENLEFSRINCRIQKGNVSSIRLVKRLGFELLEETEEAGESMLRYTKYCFFKTNKI